MKCFFSLFSVIALFLSFCIEAQAVEFKIRGQWMFGVSASEMNMIAKYRTPSDSELKNRNSDYLRGEQRFRTTFEAIISEHLAGILQFQIGTPTLIWGKANGLNGGGALGADSSDALVIRRAYLDWMLPSTDLKFRMGIQGVSLPNSAGGSVIMETNVAGITASMKINDYIGITALWARPLNDNYTGEVVNGNRIDADYLDNIDLFAITLPIEMDGFTLTPWAMYGIRGRNALAGYNGYNGGHNYSTVDGNLNYTLLPYPAINGRNDIHSTNKTYGSMFWAGIPVVVSTFKPFNFELDAVYGYVESMGRFNAVKYAGSNHDMPEAKRSSTRREGWLLKGLLEYKFDWGIPGVLGWYSSGDKGNPKDGSGRIPTLVGWGNFTSFIGDGD